MKNTIFTGAGVAIVTPMYPDGSVNYNKLGELVDYQIENGTDAIIACGTTGESAVLSHEEHLKVISQAVEAAAGRVPVIAGTGSNDTAYALELSLEAQKLGADALLIVTPYYNKTSQAGLVRHYTYIADNVDLPIIVYNVPSRTGLDVKPQTYYELSKHPNIVAIKEANGNIVAAAQTFDLCGDNIDVYSGNDDQIVPFLALGAKGVISVQSNILPRETHEICERFFNGDIKGSRDLQLKFLKLTNALFSDVNPIPVKAAMNMMGLDVGECRMPLTTMEEGAKEKLRQLLIEYGLVK